MQKKIDISVVIPVYNRGKMIVSCICSVLEQTCPPAEIIIVDDCSVDGTWQVIKQMSMQSPLIRPIRLDGNRGAQHARNVGIRAARCPWIAFNDSDDIWVKNKLETQIEELQRWKADPKIVIHSDMYRQDGEDGEFRYVPLPSFEDPRAFKKILGGYGALFQTMLVSKAALERIDYLDESVPAYQEWETTIRLASVCRFVHIPKPLFVWRRHGLETISGDVQKGLAGYQFILDKYGMDMLGRGGERLYLRHLFLLAFQLFTTGNLDSALECLENSKVQGLSIKLAALSMRLKAPYCFQKLLLRSLSRWQKLKLWLFG